MWEISAAFSLPIVHSSAWDPELARRKLVEAPKEITIAGHLFRNTAGHPADFSSYAVPIGRYMGNRLVGDARGIKWALDNLDSVARGAGVPTALIAKGRRILRFYYARAQRAIGAAGAVTPGTLSVLAPALPASSLAVTGAMGTHPMLSSALSNLRAWWGARKEFGSSVGIDTAQAIPEELGELMVKVQDGEALPWQDYFSLMRNGLVNRREGIWVITALGLRVIALEKGITAPVKAGKEFQMLVAEKSRMANYLHGYILAYRRANQIEHQDLISRMARAAGISTDTMNQVLSGMLHPLTDSQIESAAEAIGADAMHMKSLYQLDCNRIMQDATPANAYDHLISNLFVTKDANGVSRWTLISSTAYQDRDKQIVSRKAIAEDVARLDATKEYGPLLWWHTKGVVLGDCDYNGTMGPNGEFLVESGTFRDERIAEAVEKHAGSLGVSIGFLYPNNALDKDGVFHEIHRKERSLLPATQASNLFTVIAVEKEGTQVNTQQKYDEFINLFGSAETGAAVAKQIATQAVGAKATADGMGIKSKSFGGELADTAAAPAETALAVDDDKFLNELAVEVAKRLGSSIGDQVKAAIKEALVPAAIAPVASAVIAPASIAPANTEEKKPEEGDAIKAVTAQLVEMQKNFATLQAQIANQQPPAAGIIAGASQASTNVVPAHLQQIGKAVQPTEVDPMIWSLFGAA